MTLLPKGGSVEEGGGRGGGRNAKKLRRELDLTGLSAETTGVKGVRVSDDDE